MNEMFRGGLGSKLPYLLAMGAGGKRKNMTSAELAKKAKRRKLAKKSRLRNRKR